MNAARDGRRSLTVAAEVAAVVAALAAVVTLVLGDGFGGDSGDGRGGTAAPTTTGSPPAPGPTTSTGSSPAGATRYLTDLAPDSGAGNVQRVGAHSLRMACGSGDSDDRFREVSYLVPPAEHYTAFGTAVAAAGQQSTRIQALLLFDGQNATDPVTVAAGGDLPLRASGRPVQRVTLRITCDPGARTATFADPVLSG